MFLFSGSIWNSFQSPGDVVLGRKRQADGRCKDGCRRLVFKHQNISRRWKVERFSFQIDMHTRRVAVEQESTFEVAFPEALEQCQARKLLSKSKSKSLLLIFNDNIIKMFPSGFLEKTQFLTTLQYESKLERQIRGVCSTRNKWQVCRRRSIVYQLFLSPRLIFSCFCHPGLIRRCSAAQFSASRFSHCLRTDPKRGHGRQRSEGVFEEVLWPRSAEEVWSLENGECGHCQRRFCQE